jgi:hypothetical protein
VRWWLLSLIPHCTAYCWEVDGPFRSSTESAEFAERLRRGRDCAILEAPDRVPAIEAAVRLNEQTPASVTPAGVLSP